VRGISGKGAFDLRKGRKLDETGRCADPSERARTPRALCPRNTVSFSHTSKYCADLILPGKMVWEAVDSEHGEAEASQDAHDDKTLR
jgi:hypothetical protein